MEIMELPPDKLSDLRDELLAVIAKYFEVDVQSTQCSLEQDEREVAFVANVPVKRIRGRSS
jgi:cell division topological specificity factor